ncbi:MAG TPA: type II secretion system F family protein [Phycisphaeraceae bacterium]
MLMLVVQAILSLMLFGGLFGLVVGVFGYPVTAELPAHRRVAAAAGLARPTIFEHPLLAPVMNLGLTAAQRLHWATLRQRIRQDLDASGNPSGYTVEEYLAICLVCGVALGGVTAGLELLLGGRLVLMLTPVALVAGFAAPLVSLRVAAQNRLARIAKQLPYTLDLIALVMAAGASFTDAVQTLVRDRPEDDLNQELRIVLSQIGYGSTRAAALAELAQRIPLESVRSVVGAVMQAERLGTPLASILKLQSDMLRMHRSVRAERIAASASLRILLPSMLILIAVVVILFAPMIIRRIQQGGWL